MTRQLPAAKHIRDTFEDLIGRHVNVCPADPMRSAEMHQSLVAVYVDDGLKLCAVLGMTFPLAVYSAAALGLIPPGGAKDMVEEREVTPLIAENAAEICNVLGTVLNHEGQPRVRMYQTFMPGGPPPPNDAAGRLLALGHRLDLEVEVTGYGKGKFSLSLTD